MDQKNVNIIAVAFKVVYNVTLMYKIDLFDKATSIEVQAPIKTTTTNNFNGVVANGFPSEIEIELLLLLIMLVLLFDLLLVN